jgi:hypothetical protein
MTIKWYDLVFMAVASILEKPTVSIFRVEVKAWWENEVMYTDKKWLLCLCASHGSL